MEDDSLRLRAIPALSSLDDPTKRSVLSDVACLFDPAGWAAPVLIPTKVFMQDFWLADVEWDETLTFQLRERWLKYCVTLEELNRITMPRWTGTMEDHTLSLHGFSDASERAYATVVYVTGAGPSGDGSACLLVGKTKVAPVRLMSIPRLELCGALLLARLLERVAEGLRIPMERVVAWTDAKVVLAWVRQHPSRWRPFVAHRVAAVQERVPAAQGRHVPTRSNPADAATRGLAPTELESSTLWWKKPPWITKPPEDWPPEELPTTTAEEARRAVTSAMEETIANGGRHNLPKLKPRGKRIVIAFFVVIPTYSDNSGLLQGL